MFVFFPAFFVSFIPTSISVLISPLPILTLFHFLIYCHPPVHLVSLVCLRNSLSCLIIMPIHLRK